MFASTTRVLRAAILLGCAAALWAEKPGGTTPPSSGSSSISTAYLREQLVSFDLVPLQKGQQPFAFGPWQFGVRVFDRKPRDNRLNLYLVFPGKLHQAEGHADFDHNDIINALPPEGAVVEWDVYWVIVLDPALRQELRSEREMILQAQEGFTPGDLFEFRDVPGHAFLQAFLNTDSLDDLARYRMKDGRLPRMIIVPAGFAVRASAAPQETEPREVEAASVK